MSNIYTSPQYSKGTTFWAEYSDSLINDYRGNPLIEALPPIMSKEEMSESLIRVPAYDTEERKLPPEIRSHCVDRLFSYYQPMEITLRLEHQFSRLLRQGYIDRNPLAPEYRNRVVNTCKSLEEGKYSEPNSPRSVADIMGFSITGLSGVGKTIGINKVLSTYPQLLLHNQYKDMDLHVYQIAWLKIDCPHDGALKGL